MGKQKPKIFFSNFSFYVYLLNYLLIFTVLWYKYLDIYYTLILLEDSQVSETIPISQWILSFDPFIAYAISLIPITLFFVVNYYLRKKQFYLIILSVFLIGFIIYLIPIVQNSINILNQI